VLGSSFPIFVKVCGLTREEDAAAAARCGAAAAGFIFSKSPRRVSPERARAIADALPAHVVRVGVFVDEPSEAIRDIVARANLDAVQLHGSEPPDVCADMPVPVIKALRVRGDDILPPPEAYVGAVAAFLLDTYSDVAAGGTGMVFSWETIENVRACGVPVIVAGGLTPDNVGALIEAFTPDGIDVSSGVEESPGIKSAEKLRAFFAAARRAAHARARSMGPEPDRAGRTSPGSDIRAKLTGFETILAKRALLERIAWQRLNDRVRK